MNKKRIIIIGLDGGTFDVIKPLIELGVLPNIKSLKEKGAYGVLKSVIPPVTGPAWTFCLVAIFRFVSMGIYNVYMIHNIRRQISKEDIHESKSDGH